MDHWSDRYLNRELSILAFHRRVLCLAEDSTLPLLERLKFLCISSANLDEFFEVRYAALKKKKTLGLQKTGVDETDLSKLLHTIHQQASLLVKDQHTLLQKELIPHLEEEGIYFLRRGAWNELQVDWLKGYMSRHLMPVISPLGIDPSHPFPRVVNKYLQFIVSLEGKDAFGREHRLAIVPVPRSLPRLIALPEEISGVPLGYVFLSSIIHAFIGDLFPGMAVKGCYQFSLTRDTELYLDEEAMADLKLEVEGRLQTTRRFGRVVRLEVANNCPQNVIAYLLEKFDLTDNDLYKADGPMNLSRLEGVYKDVDRDDLKFANFAPSMPDELMGCQNMFDVVRKQDVLLHHPYQSFEPVIKILEQAAEDSQVLAIKQTLYRTGDQSRIVRALCRAARNDIEVNVVVELRARFDEEENIQLAEELQLAGAHVVYGVVGYKTHAKVQMIVRKEGERLVRYTHLGTGNYHDGTARSYTDFGLLTSDPDIGADIHKLFQGLTGLGHASRMKKVVQAPFDLHKKLLALIEEEALTVSKGGKGRIIAKMNGLEDPALIDALYKASQQGVKIDLIVRGICCLKPGVKGYSENIKVRSVLGRFLEHSRVFCFGDRASAKVYCASADWLVRNQHHRVETAFPILVPHLKRRVVREGLRFSLAENTHAWRLNADGFYRRQKIRQGKRMFSAQNRLLDELCS